MIPPREYVFIVDVSGSMHGFPLDTTKALMRDLLGRLRPTDTFNVVLFSGGSSARPEKIGPATTDEIADAIAFIDREDGGGGTELLPALERAMKLPRLAKDMSRSFVVVTDGYIAEEPADVRPCSRPPAARRTSSRSASASSVNRHLIDGIANAGQGEPFVMLDADAGEGGVDEVPRVRRVAGAHAGRRRSSTASTRTTCQPKVAPRRVRESSRDACSASTRARRRARSRSPASRARAASSSTLDVPT